MRFVAQTWFFVFSKGEYLRIRPEVHRRGDVAPPMQAGSELLIGGKVAQVLWADGDTALIEHGGQRWLMSHLTPVEAFQRPAYAPGEGCQEWIVRRPG